MGFQGLLLYTSALCTHQSIGLVRKRAFYSESFRVVVETLNEELRFLYHQEVLRYLFIDGAKNMFGQLISEVSSVFYIKLSDT